MCWDGQTEQYPRSLACNLQLFLHWSGITESAEIMALAWTETEIAVGDKGLSIQRKIFKGFVFCFKEMEMSAPEEMNRPFS